MTKVNEQNWGQLDFLINNFYEIVEYKRGRGIYGDRVVLKRPRLAESVFKEPSKLTDFYYMDANAVKELPRTVQEKIKFILRFVISPESMNIICDYGVDNEINPTEWAFQTRAMLLDAKTLDFCMLNKILLSQYKKLGANFVSNLNKHREKQYFLATSEEFNFVSKEHADEQMKLL